MQATDGYEGTAFTGTFDRNWQEFKIQFIYKAATEMDILKPSPSR
jgi:hypothetical protein